MVLAIFLTIALGTVTVLFAKQKKVQPAVPVIIAVVPYAATLIILRLALKDILVAHNWDEFGKIFLIQLAINFVVMFGGAGGMFLVARWFILRQAPPPDAAGGPPGAQPPARQ
ncbi:MAG: hypothetical protein ABIJ56_00915 [Pseudomonadota bacterium]